MCGSDERVLQSRAATTPLSRVRAVMCKREIGKPDIPEPLWIKFADIDAIQEHYEELGAIYQLRDKGFRFASL